MSNFRRPLTLLSSLALLAASTLFFACGIATAPVSVPAAFAHNDFLGLKGTITDQNGTPVDDVLITVKRGYYLWHANASYTEYDTKAFLSPHTLNVPAQRASDLAFTFHKEGYQDVPVFVTTSVMNAGDHLFPNNTPLHVIMPKNSDPSPIAISGNTELDFTDSAKLPSVNLANFFLNSTPLVPQGEPAHRFYATTVPRPRNTSTTAVKIDPLDINLPASLTFHLDNPDDGLLPFTPKATTNLSAEPAPTGPYSHEFTLPAQRLRQLRQRPFTHKFTSDRCQHFYFRVAGRTGIGYFFFPERNLESDEGRKLELHFSFTLFH